MAAPSMEERLKQAEERALRAERMAQRALDVQEIQNVMSRHSAYDAAGMNREQIKAIWAQKAPDVSFGQNHGLYVGLEAITKYYCDLWEQKLRPERLEQMTKLFPQIKKVKENELAGFMKMHTNATPIIEVAGDGKTAKGLWESPGFITEIMDGRLQAIWIWERLAVDFIKEDGKWKIWHFNGFVHMMTPYEKSWVTSSIEPRLQPTAAGYGFPPTHPAVRHEPYSPTRVQKFFPRPPEPYETFSETFSYGL